MGGESFQKGLKSFSAALSQRAIRLATSRRMRIEDDDGILDSKVLTRTCSSSHITNGHRFRELYLRQLLVLEDFLRLTTFPIHATGFELCAAVFREWNT
jgi:hypothetical protein